MTDQPITNEELVRKLKLRVGALQDDHPATADIIEIAAERLQNRWREARPSQKFYDGAMILCAVPLADGGCDFAVVTVHCDEDYFALRCNGEHWGWEWADVQWWMPVDSLPGFPEPVKAKND